MISNALARPILVILLLAALGLLTPASLPARAATFEVNSSADAVDANPSDDVCATAYAECTLGAAGTDGLADTPWPMFQHDTFHAGQSPHAVREAPPVCGVRCSSRPIATRKGG